MAEFDLDDDELLEEELALAKLDRTRPSEHQRLGGANRGFSWLLIIGGLIGVLASIELVLAEIALIEDPSASLSCDLNPFIGCSSSLLEWQSHLLFGIPNALIGVAIFAMVLGVGCAFLAGARLARWFWRVMCAVVLAGLAFIAWFLGQSLTVFGTLCPWCMTSWAVVIVVGVQVIARAAQAGHLPISQKLGRAIYRERWLITIGIFLLIILAIVIGLWGTWRLYLGL